MKRKNRQGQLTESGPKARPAGPHTGLLRRPLAENDVHQFLLGIAQFHAVDGQKHQHHVGINAKIRVSQQRGKRS